MKILLAILVMVAISARAQFESPAMVGAMTAPATGGGAAYTAYATTFIGTNCYFTTGSTMSLTNSTKMTFSAWFKIDANPSAQTWLLTFRNASSFISRSSGAMKVNIRGTVTNPSYVWEGTTQITNGSGWHHLWVSLDGTDGSTALVYLDGTSASGSWTTYVTNALINYQVSTLTVGATVGGGNALQGCLCELWFDNQYSSDPTKWISGGKPVNLGSDGSTPTGVQPAIYLRDPYTSFTNNYGYGTNFWQGGTNTQTSCTPP